jgi:phosphatidylserine/phosphatidylglycerophosphate/cardiolipin synthase-like enzyme
LEVTVEILDAKVAQALVVNYELDMQNAEPFDAAAWAKLPWWKKALSWIAYRCRRFL